MISTVVRVAVAAVLLVALAVAPAVRADSPPERVGVLLADESFREFFQHLIAMGVIPRWLTALETWTILYDADCPACPSPSDSPRLVDARLRPHDGPAVFVPASESLPAHT